VSDDARRVLTEEEQALARIAKAYGLTCGSCGKPLAEGETVWIQRLGVGPTYSGRGVTSWRAPVCGACAAPAFRAETEGAEPERCAGCGRGVHYGAGARRSRLALCSRTCGSRYRRARAKEARGS